MPVTNSKICVLFATLIVLFLTGCANENNPENENSKNDTMKTTTLEKEPGLQTTIKGSAGSLFVNDGGAGGIPVLFVHSFGGSTAQWENQLDHLRSNRRAIAFDLRGHGQSASPSDNNYSIEALVTDIAAVADSLKLDKFILAGHSMGGSAAIAYAGRHPGKIAGLLLTGTPGKTPPEQSAPVIASLESEKYETVMEQYMKKLLTHAAPATDKLEREGMDKLSKEACISIIKAIFKYDPLTDLRNYPGPKLIISGATEDETNSLHIFFPGIPYKKIEGTSHWIQLDKPAEFNKVLDEFLSKVEKETK